MFGTDFNNFMNPNAVPTTTPAQPNFTAGTTPFINAAPQVGAASYTPDGMTMAPQSVNDLYAQVLGRAPDAGGLAYWQQQFGDTVDPNELATFTGAAQAELANRSPEERAALAPSWGSADAYGPPAPTVNADAYFAANPDVAAAYKQQTYGLDPTQFAQAHYTNYGANEQRVTPTDQNALYNQIVQQSYGTIGRTGVGADAGNIDQAGLDYWKGQLASGAIKPQDFSSVFNNAVNVYKQEHPEDKYTQYVNNWQNTQTENAQIKDYVSQVLADKTLTPWEQTQKLMEQAKKNNITEDRLASIYGKDNLSPYANTYKTGINDFLTKTLAKDPGTTMNEVGAIHQAAQKYGLTAEQMAKYSGLDPNAVNSYFSQYEQGLGSIVSRLNDPKMDDVTKTQTALALAQQYGTTDAELAKASNGKWKEEDVKAYLDPVRNVPANLQKLMDDPKATASDITNFINDAKKDPRASGIYGVALDKVLSASPELVMRDIQNGTGSLAENYKNFLTQAKATPESAAKYAPQIAQVQKMLDTATFSADEVYGGKPQDYQLQIVSKLPASAMEKIPQKLEFTPVKLETRDDGEGGKYQVQVGGGVKTKGVVPIDDEDPRAGYKATEPTTINGSSVYATYDASGNLTGYNGDASQRSWLDRKHSISGNWDANGNPKVASYTSKGGGLRGEVNSLMSDPVLGSLANIAASYFGGPLGVAALAAVQGVPPEEILKRAVISMAASEVGGQVSGSTAGSLGAFGSQAAGQFAGNLGAGILSGQNLNSDLLTNAAVNAGVNAGVNVGTNSLLGASGMDKLGAMQPYATGIASNVISSSLLGKDPNIQNALVSTAMKEAMKTGTQTLKDAYKSAKAP